MTTHCLTIDYEQWYHGLLSQGKGRTGEDRLQPVTELLLEVFQEYNVHATFFVLGSVAEQHPQLVRLIQQQGHEIACHGYAHDLVSRQTQEEFQEDLKKSLDILQSVIGHSVSGYRAPFFSINKTDTPWAWEVLREQGLIYDSSLCPMSLKGLYGAPGADRFRHTINIGDDSIQEIPISTVRWLGRTWPFAGGFYIRAMPYRMFRRALQRIEKEGQIGNIYFHPWEFDPEQPKPNVTARERITHYTGLKGTLNKLRRLLTDFTFGPILQVHGGLWTEQAA